jgi:hypothetical protein
MLEEIVRPRLPGPLYELIEVSRPVLPRGELETSISTVRRDCNVDEDGLCMTKTRIPRRCSKQLQPEREIRGKGTRLRHGTVPPCPAPRRTVR